MKVLVNGGLNLSELDGWWAEAYSAEVGWALGDGREHREPEWDAAEARQLYALLEDEIVPAFYARDATGMPRDWIARVRASMATLAPRFSGSRMVCDYVEQNYLPAAAAYAHRIANGGAIARALRSWESNLRIQWEGIQLGSSEAARRDDGWLISVEVYVGDLDPDTIAVELYADASETQEPVTVPMQRAHLLTGGTRGYRYRAQVGAARPAQDYTVRVVPHHPQANVPIELPLILWQR